MSQVPGPMGAQQFTDLDEQPVDVPRFLAALRRGWWLIALIVVPFTGVVLALSLILPKTYDATARLVVQEDSGTLAPPDNETITRRLATIQTLLTSREILSASAAELRGETPDTLRDKVSASVDDIASIVDLRATDTEAAGAAEIANRVARTFVDRRREDQRRRLTDARDELQAALDRLRGTAGASAEISALRERLTEVNIAALSADGDLEIAEAAESPDSPSSPRPVENTLVAFFAAAFLAILVVVGREAVAPRISGPRELSRLTGLVPLVVMPAPGRRSRMRQAGEAYQTLAAAVRLQLPETRRILVVTSAHREEARLAVADGLARALADGGAPTLLVAADLRRSRPHEPVGVAQAPGLAEVLRTLEQSDDDNAADVIRSAIHAPRDDSGGRLRVLPSGNPSLHPAALLSGNALSVLFEALSQSRYRFVVVEGAPLLGPIDGQLLARGADAVLVVCRLDRLSPGEASELADVLARTETPALGAVVVGGTSASYSLAAIARESATTRVGDG